MGWHHRNSVIFGHSCFWQRWCCLVAPGLSFLCEPRGIFSSAGAERSARRGTFKKPGDSVSPRQSLHVQVSLGVIERYFINLWEPFGNSACKFSQLFTLDVTAHHGGFWWKEIENMTRTKAAAQRWDFMNTTCNLIDRLSSYTVLAARPWSFASTLSHVVPAICICRLGIMESDVPFSPYNTERCVPASLSSNHPTTNAVQLIHNDIEASVN